ncbi:carboxypeptidase-like regulatory domain-containing protein [Muricauda sp. ANG21]|uniref:carboxypeptidase-like regulatory domain-containing protein n=1 Tax=Allomuricauda sp. ANG21 TaxID=3042468 RepID=UPI00345206AF
MKAIIISSILLLFTAFSHGQNTIHGKITHLESPLQGVQVTNLSTGQDSNTDQKGSYVITASPKEELRFSYMGMDTTSVIVEDVTKTLNIKMKQKVEKLREVTVSKKVLKGQKELELEYDSNPNIIKSAYGYINKETANYSLRILDEDEVGSAPQLDFLLTGRFAGVRAMCDPLTDELVVSMRSSGSLNRPTNAIQSLSMSKGSLSPGLSSGRAVFDVDGVILTRIACSTLWGNVRRIAFIPSYAGLARYGHLGVNGVVVVNTKTGTHTPKNADGKPFDQAKLRNNYLNESAVVNAEGSGASLPGYLKELKESQSTEAAKAVFEENKLKYGNHPFFYLDSYLYFYEKDIAYSNAIFDTYMGLAEENPVLLKAMAYVLESQGQRQKAHSLYKQVYKLRPEYAQSFIDMANSYRNLDRPQSAASLYARHSYLLEEGLLPTDSMELAAIMQREVDNLFDLDNGSLKIKKRKKDFDERSTRLVFDWNDSEAEFDLQFVNPENQYFEWKHTKDEMPERIRSEKELGYAMADFLLDNELLGRWKVNATYHGNKQVTPTYIKATIYRNYGSKLQSKEVKVFKLGMQGVNQHLFDLRIPSEVVQN